MNCLKCNEEFKPKHKYHEFCSKKCRVKNYCNKERKPSIKASTYTNKVTVKKEKSIFFDWRNYPFGMY